VLHDIRTTIARRFPRPILVWPVPVQGEGAAARIAAAINGFSALPLTGPGILRPDVLIVARGGGSLEDLMAFNEEIVLRAVAACPIPLISAVGHETDTTLIDFVSDRRAPTPTAAAELAIPVRYEMIADLQHRAARLTGALARLAQTSRLRLGQAERGLPDLPSLAGAARQRLDDRAGRLGLALPNLLAARRARLVQAERHLPDPRSLPAASRARLTLTGTQLSAALRHGLAGRAAAAQRVMGRLTPANVQARLREARAVLDGLGARLHSVSYEAVLARGYALVLDGKGHALTSAAAVPPGSRLTLRFGDGEVKARSEGRQGTLL